MKVYRARPWGPPKRRFPVALPTNNTASATRARVSALQAPSLCSWCLGAGQYLEPLECDVGHAYLPIVCECCDGRGHRVAA